MKLKQSQKTTVPDEKMLEKKAWFLIDVKGKTLGRISTKIADLLRGKQKPYFTPQHDCGDFIVIINAKDIRLSGNKKETKLYRWHTGYAKGLRTRTAQQVLDKKPENVLYDAVWGMLPRNKLRKHMMKKLRIFPSEAHDHVSQNPKPISL